MEIPDVIAINKLDHPMAKTMLNEVRQVLALGPHDGWKPPIVLTEAMRGEGIETLWDKIEEHQAWLRWTGNSTPAPRATSHRGVPGRLGARRRHLELPCRDDPELRRLLDDVAGAQSSTR